MRVVFLLGMIILIVFSSCQKIMDYYSINTTKTIPVCRIKSFSSLYYGSEIRTSIRYNNQGNPSTIFHFADWLPEGKATEKFYYDSLDRLIAHEPDLLIGNIRNYVYEGDSRIPIADTATDFQGKKYLESFKTDTKGRIIEVEIKWIYSPPYIEDDFEFPMEEYHYYYDVRGNRQVNPFDYPWHKSIIYTDKPSLYSLNPVWQLIHRDYSKNGIKNVTTFNESGLPVTFVFDEFAYWQPFLDMNMNSTVVYECEGGK